MKTINGEKYFSEILENDMPGLIPDQAIEKRLDYILSLKAKEGRVSENSFLSVIHGFFSLRYFGIKAGIVTVLLVITLLFYKIPDRRVYHLRTSPFFADSSYCDTLSDMNLNGIVDME